MCLPNAHNKNSSCDVGTSRLFLWGYKGMIEVLFLIVKAMVDIVVAIVTTTIEFIAGLFITGAETLTAGEAILIFFAFIAEVIVWAILWLWELIKALLQRLKPKKIYKPKL